MSPDAIIIFSAGVMPLPEGGERATTYEESDAFGTLGGHDRVEAAALLARTYPKAYLVTTSRHIDGHTPSLAEVYADELHALGVERERIVQEESSTTTETLVTAAFRLAKKRGWGHMIFVSNEYHVPRIAAFCEQEKDASQVSMLSSESVLMEADPTFGEYFEKVKTSPAYQMRLAAEAQGIRALTSGKYHPAPAEDKKERRV